MLSGKRIRRWSWTAMLIVFGGAMWVWFPREPTFAQCARRVMAIDEKTYSRDYQWRNEHEVWLRHFVPQPGERPGYSDDLHRPLALLSYDTTTRVLHPLVDINRRLDVNEFGFRDWAQSPDRHWLMVKDRDDINLIQIDGPISRRIRHDGRWDEDYWLGDSRHWISLFGGGSGQSLDYPEAHVWNLPSDWPQYALSNSASRLLCENKWDSYGACGNTVMFILDTNYGDSADEDRSSITIVRRVVMPVDGPSSVTEVSLPQTSRIYQTEIAPQCDRIACILRNMATPPPILSWFAKHLHIINIAPKPVYRLWVYDLKSKLWSEVALLGSVPDQDDDDKRPGDLKWLPDGKRLSLIYNAALWTLPAR